MKRTKLLQEIRKMRFQEAYSAWSERRLTQEEAAQLLGVCERTFRRYIDRYEEDGLEGLIDKRLEQVSHRRAPLDEVMAVVQRYQGRHSGWNVKHFYAWYRRDGGERGYTWVKSRLQEAGAVKKAKRRGPHRRRREAAAWAGMMLHQDGSTHEWVPGQWWDLIVTMDDATNEHYSMFFVDEEGTASSLRGVREVIDMRGLFCSLYTDRGSHYWHTPEAGGKVDKRHLTQVGRAMQQLGIEMIAAYSPEARGRSERMFRTHQDRLPKELAAAGITTMEGANRYLREAYLPAFNTEFAHASREAGSGFVAYVGRDVGEILCEHFERVVGKNNCVDFDTMKLQIPADRSRCHYVKAKVRVHQYADGALAVFHGPRCLGRYTATGQLRRPECQTAA
ncbi:MAG: ISNCY family transposase [Burkholderiales bacterium]